MAWDAAPAILMRVGVALAFLSVPTFADRFGSITFPVICLGLTAACAFAASSLRAARRQLAATLLAVDAMSIALVVPAASLASTIGVADPRLGGGAARFAAASAVVIGAVAIVAIAASWLSADAPDTAIAAVVPATMTVAALVAGFERYSTGNVSAGLALAWFAAAATTIAFAVVASGTRTFVSMGGFAGFSIAVVALGRVDGGEHITASSAALALLTTAICGAALLLVPMVVVYLTGAPGDRRSGREERR